MSDITRSFIFKSGATALTTDTALDAWAIGETLAVNGNPIFAIFLAMGIGTIYLTIKVGFLYKALELAEDIKNPRRAISLALNFCFVLCFALASVFFNIDRLAGDMLKGAITQTTFDTRNDVKARLEQHMDSAFDQKANIQAVHDSSEQWYSCEVSSGCIGGAAGEGPISSLLSSIMLTSHSALDSLIDLEADIEPLRARADHLIKLYEELETIVDLDFDGKQERRAEISEKLNATLSEIRGMIPVSVFNGLRDELGKSAATYRALSIGEEASKRLRTKFEPFAQEFERQADLMRGANRIYLPPIEEPTKLEIFTSTSDGIVYWIISIALAFGVWIMVFIHVISVRATPISETREPPFAHSSAQH